MGKALADIRTAVKEGRILWKRHALERMLERDISRRMVKQAVLNGKVIETYPDDHPVPSLLICCLEPKPLHVVLAWDAGAKDCHLVTAYRPDLEHFEPGFERRRKK